MHDPVKVAWRKPITRFDSEPSRQSNKITALILFSAVTGSLAVRQQIVTLRAKAHTRVRTPSCLPLFGPKGMHGSASSICSPLQG